MRRHPPTAPLKPPLPHSLLTPDPLPLLLQPRSVLEALDYLSSHPNPAPKTACASLHLSMRDYYAILSRLESLNLVAIERFPGNRVRRAVDLTAQGRSALHLVRGLRASIDGSQASLELQLAEDPPRPGSPEVGAILLRLLEYAERRADYDAMKQLEARSRALGRPGEAAFAAGLSKFLQGDRLASVKDLKAAVSALAGESTGRSYRRALYFYAAALDASGDGRASYVEFTRVRRLAKAAGDDATESDARLGIAILKALRSQWADAAEQLEVALQCAKRTGSPGRQAKVLTSLCLTEFLLDGKAGLARSEEALALARKAGAKILIMHIRANRALMFAYHGDSKAASKEMAAARRISREAGYEPGPRVLEGWTGLVREIALAPRATSLPELGSRLAALMKGRGAGTAEDPPNSS